MQLTIQALPIVMGKPIRNVCLGTVKYGWKYTEVIGNIFYLDTAIFEIPK